MNDAEAQRLLAGIDAPRPLPASLRDDLLTTLTESTALTSADAPRPLPDDLRHRLEASLITATARPVPRSLRRRVLGATTRPSPQLLGAVAAVLVLFVVGIVLATQPSGDDADLASSGPKSATSTTAAAVAGSDSGTSGLSEFDANNGGGSAAATGDSAAPTASGGGTAQASRSAAPPIEISIASQFRLDADIKAGFDGYLATVNASGGIDGRQLTTLPEVDNTPNKGGVAIVELGTLHYEFPDQDDRVLFDTAWYPSGSETGLHLSLASPLDRQVQIAVATAYPNPKQGTRVAVYATMVSDWYRDMRLVYEDELQKRGITAIEVPFDPRTPTYVPNVDAAFLVMPPNEVEAWINDAPGRLPNGVWTTGFGYDDRLAPKAETVGMRVLSPYEPLSGAEADAARRAAPSHALNERVIHGWVTAKALVHLLRTNGGATLGATDVARLRGWDSGWAPPFAIRGDGNDRTPEAILLRPKDGRFVAEGSFLRSSY
jgi:hypothetical protein